MPEIEKTIHVAVGVIVNTDGDILIALRPDHVHQGGLWEFPGGKVETGETVQQALTRELQEELGIQSVEFRPLIEIRHEYEDKTVFLDVWWVDSFIGQAMGVEGQEVRWVGTGQLDNYTFPAANKPIVEAIERSVVV